MPDNKVSLELKKLRKAMHLPTNQNSALPCRVSYRTLQ